MTDTITQHPTLSALRGALLVMEAAEKAGLPIPTHVTTSSYAEVKFGAGTSVSWQPDSLDDLRAWATYLDQPITTDSTTPPRKVYHYVDAVLFDQRVDLCVIQVLPAAATRTREPGRCSCGQPGCSDGAVAR